MFKNISNHTSKSNFGYTNFNHLQISQDFFQQQLTAPIIIKRNPRKSSSKLLNKKSVKNMIPKYLTNHPCSLEKEKLLFDIEKENLKLNQQNAVRKALERKLQKKICEKDKKHMSLQKFVKCQTQMIQGLERTITSSLQKPFILHPSQNYIKSINNQIQMLTQQIQKNEETILKIKQSKKYTRFLENQEQKSTFLNELRSLKRYKKKLKIEINRLKRVHMEKKSLRMKELILQGEIQNGVEVENIQIYKYIQQIKQQVKQTTFKKASLLKKKTTLIQQIQQFKDKYNITDDFIEAYYQPHTFNLTKTNLSGFSSSKNSTQYRPLTSNVNDLASLKQEDYEQDDTNPNINYAKISSNLKSESYKRDNIVENAASTVKVNSKIPSDDGEFMGVSYNDSNISQKTIKEESQRKILEKLEKKYFYEDEDFESDEDNSEKDYGSEEYDQNDDFYEEEGQNDVQNDKNRKNIGNQGNVKKMVGVKEEKTIQPQQKPEKYWSNKVLRGISI